MYYEEELIDGVWYCAIHDPAKVKARQEKSSAKWSAEWEEKKKAMRLQIAAPDLLAALEQAVRYIEVSVAYQGAMTAAQVEERIAQNANLSVTQIGANSCNTLASFDFFKARDAIKKARGEK